LNLVPKPGDDGLGTIRMPNTRFGHSRLSGNLACSVSEIITPQCLPVFSIDRFYGIVAI
jgi:hypothetical protein